MTASGILSAAGCLTDTGNVTFYDFEYWKTLRNGVIRGDCAIFNGGSKR